MGFASMGEHPCEGTGKYFKNGKCVYRSVTTNNLAKQEFLNLALKLVI
jgi:hypothetical protein